MDGIWKMPMQAQLAAVRSGALRAEALVQEYLKRLTRCGGPDGLNVLAELNPHVLEEARALDAQTARSGLLFGLPILVKDNIDVDACLMTWPTNAMHFCGLPSVALRLGMDASGAPCGMILYGADEKRLFSAALCIEQYAGPISWPQGIE